MDDTNTNTEETNVEKLNAPIEEDVASETPSPALFGIDITWAEGHGVHNEEDAAQGAKIVQEFYDRQFTDEDMPDCIQAITIKRL